MPTAPAPASPAPTERLPGANATLALLLAINLFNYIDRQVLAAVLPRMLVDGSLFAPDDADIKFKAGLLTSAFLAVYMVVSPAVAWLDGHGYRRWWILGLGVTVWSLASGGSGFAVTYWMLFLTRCLVGVGEGAYGPVASAMLADIYPLKSRGAVMAAFNMAIPVGSALGFVIGGQVSAAFNDWRPAFWVTFAGLGLGALCFLRREHPRPARAAGAVTLSYPATLALLARNRSYALCCAGLTAVTFVIGGLAVWVPTYVLEREGRYVFTPVVVAELESPPSEDLRRPVPAAVAAKLLPLADGAERDLIAFRKHLAAGLTRDELKENFDAVVDAAQTPESLSVGRVTFIFGMITVVGGLLATVIGAWLGEKLRPRLSGAYFWVTAAGCAFALPCYLGVLVTPLPVAWGLLFLTVVGLFLHVGPAFTILANVVPAEVRATAFATNIFVIHALGDVISPPLMGWVAGDGSLQPAFVMLGGVIALAAVLFALGARHLDADTRAADAGA